ncbi:hypothetical protein MPLA_1340007 [Mesorhizobium sp. ORS 3359]|nr:hypothetical protein MPLA_1340007 [Mesorhizobium sp. ORS 3359]
MKRLIYRRCPAEHYPARDFPLFRDKETGNGHLSGRLQASRQGRHGFCRADAAGRMHDAPADRH